MPTTVHINNIHNYAILNAEALSFRKIDPITRSVFNSYYHQGMSPTAASDFHIHQLDLNPELENDAVSRADAALNPTRSTVASPCHLVLSTRRVLATVLTILLQCFLSAVTSLSSASFIPVTSCISSIHFLLGRPLLLLPSPYASIILFS